VDVNICEESGCRVGSNCNGKTTLVQLNGLKAQVCLFHVLVHLDKEKRNLVSSSCYPVKDMATQNWFVLPPAQEYYFKKRNANYKSLAPFKQFCDDASKEDNIEIIYPRHKTKVYVPKGLDGIRQKLIFEALQRQESMKLFWHLNDVYLATTSGKHQIVYLHEIGKHYLTLVDETENSFVIQFEVLEK
jgi:penicillin-binding protein 1C|tara:strand:- start:1240 stop:1803 length:564 start_codon:yes stop_codon:yes gene_type:complete